MYILFKIERNRSKYKFKKDYYNFIFNSLTNKPINTFIKFNKRLNQNIKFLRHLIPFIFSKWSEWKTPNKNLVIAKIFIYLNHPSIFYYLNNYLDELKYFFYIMYRKIYFTKYILKENIKLLLKEFYLSSKFVKKNKNWYKIFIKFVKKGLKYFYLNKNIFVPITNTKILRFLNKDIDNYTFLTYFSKGNKFVSKNISKKFKLWKFIYIYKKGLKNVVMEYEKR